VEMTPETNLPHLCSSQYPPLRALLIATDKDFIIKHASTEQLTGFKLPSSVLTGTVTNKTCTHITMCTMP
ncbi:hypothetical protein ACPE5A_004984, partial [Escherichia coli]